MRIAVAIVLLLVGCQRIPEPLNDEVAPPEHVSEATAVVVAEWRKRVPGADRLSIEDAPRIRWFVGVPAGTRSDPVCLDYGNNECRLGLFIVNEAFGEEMHLVIYPALHESGLAHEMLHWALYRASGDGDALHVSSLWSQVVQVKSVLRDAGM